MRRKTDDYEYEKYYQNNNDRCSNCKGSGHVDGDRCPSCEGSGVEPEWEEDEDQ